MDLKFRLTRQRLIVGAVAAAIVTAGGAAYASIPSDRGVFNGCMLKSTGAVRLIDPALPAASSLSHCTALEQAISWNQKGPG